MTRRVHLRAERHRPASALALAASDSDVANS